MTPRLRQLQLLLASLAGTALAVPACGDDADSPSGSSSFVDSGTDSGMPGAADASGNAGAGPLGGDSSVPPGQDASGLDAALNNQVAFTVPANGGSVDISIGGTVITFTFPDSAAGQDITLTPAAATDVGWDEGIFSAVIEMQPDGLVFDDPVIVTPSTGELLLLTLPSSPTQSRPELLQLAGDGSGLELNHFSYLALVPPANWCESSGWEDAAGAQDCSNQGDNSTLRTFTCKNYQFCNVISASCCVPGGDAGSPSDGCNLTSTFLGYSFTPTDSNGGEYPYCDSGDGGLQADAGMSCDEAWVAQIGGGDANFGGAQCAINADSGAQCAGVLRMFTTSCTNFCASIGLSCIYANQLNGGGDPSCSVDPNAFPPQTPTTHCSTVTDLNIWCSCG